MKHVREVSVTHARQWRRTRGPDLNPVTQGYALTGDQNIVHVNMVARYRVRDPAEWAFYGPKAEDVLRVEVTAAMVRSLGEMGVDRVLADGRKELVATATRRAQAGLDAAHSGLEISSLELTRLAPPVALASEFDAVQSAFIGAETSKEGGPGLRRDAHPAAQAEADSSVQSARADGAEAISQRQGRVPRPSWRWPRSIGPTPRWFASACTAMPWKRPSASLARCVGCRRPIGGSYHGLRITVPVQLAPVPSLPRNSEEGGDDR